MKARFFTLALFIIIAISSTSCNRNSGIFCENGKGELVTQTLALSDFTGFDNQVAADVILTQGETQSVTITAQQNVIDKLKTKVSGDVWKIDFEGCVNYKAEVIIEITLPTLTLVGISGSGNVTSTNRFTELGNIDMDVAGSGDITLDMDAQGVNTNISGSGHMDLDLTTNVLTSRISGSGEFKLQGTADSHDFRVSGSGDLYAYNLETRATTVKVAGSGKAEVRASESLNVNISGSGDVSYKGTPAVDVNITGSGKLVNAN